MKIEYSEILKKSNELFHEMESYRRTIHKNPELSQQEYETSEFIQEQLARLDIPFRMYAKTGVAGLIGSGENCVALRADIDALPIQEETGLGFQSENKGIMHACGHDLHTAMLLGAAEILKFYEKDLNGSVKLIFQPSEEKLPGGAKMMIEEGVLEEPAPKAVFGQHVFPQEAAGIISVSSGPVMASANGLEWKIIGKGGHAAQPHLYTDTILAASQLITYLHSYFNKLKSPLAPAVLSITMFHGGNAPNIFPDEVVLKGTLRTYNEKLRVKLLNDIEERSQEFLGAFDIECIFSASPSYPPLVNNPATTELVRGTAMGLFGENSLIDFEPLMWAEDFAYYTGMLPGTFWFLGVRPPHLDEMPGLHTSNFMPDEEAMKNGAALLAATAINFLNKSQ